MMAKSMEHRLLGAHRLLFFGPEHLKTWGTNARETRRQEDIL